MSIFSEPLRAFAHAGWQDREPLAAARLPELAAARGGLSGDERVVFEYITGTLPLTDLGDYPAALFVEAARHALRVREEFGWCAALPEQLFLREVACPRVNNEELDGARQLFYRELAPRVRGLSAAGAALEVNRWCAEQVCYRPADDRTASAMDIYRRGWGRCGEESVFAVNALRSVGLAARQVYAPRWSHCDDNHAWVEVFDGEGWRFMGACEPEPRLDMGWFTCAAGRAMLCHAKAFVGGGEGWQALFPDTGPLELDRREGVAYESVTARYAQTRPFTITVNGPEGPAAGAEVTLYILNEGGLWPIARRLTDSRGCAALSLGLGSLWVTAQKDGLLAEALANTAEAGELCLSLTGGTAVPAEFDFFAPEDCGRQNPPLSAGEKQLRRETLASAKALRESRALAAPEVEPRSREVVSMLTEKDRAVPVPGGVLEESLGVTGGPELASPRIGLEPLAPWRRLLKGVGPAQPERLLAWLQENTAPANSFAALPQTPAGVLRLGRAGALGLPVAFCALCRAKGIPARLGADGQPEYWRDGRFCRADGLDMGEITIESGGETGSWSLMRLSGGWQPVKAAAGEGAVLPVGRYRLMTAVRLPNGDQLGRFCDFTLEAGERKAVRARFRTTEGHLVLQKLRLPEMGFAWQGPALLCWAGPGEEPTEHLLGELKAVWQRLGELGCGVVLTAKEPEKLGFVPPGAKLGRWDGDAAEAVARRVYQEPGVLPLVVLADSAGHGRFACAGYRVGLGELVTALMEKLKAEGAAG